MCLLLAVPSAQRLEGQEATAAVRPTLLLVTNHDDNTVSIFDATSAPKSVRTVAVDTAPGGLCVSPDGNRAYVLSKTRNSLSVIDLMTLEASPPVAPSGLEGPQACVVGPDNQHINVLTASALVIVAANTNRVIQRLPLDEGLAKVALAPDGRQLYVSNDRTGDVYVVDVASGTLSATIRAGFSSRNMAFTPDGQALLVANTLQDTLSVVDLKTNQVVTTIGVGTAPQTIGVASDGALAFVVARGTHHLNIVAIDGKDTRKSFRSIDLLQRPIGMAMTDRNIYVIHDAGELSVVRVRTLETFEYLTVKTGRGPAAIAIRR